MKLPAKSCAHPVILLLQPRLALLYDSTRDKYLENCGPVDVHFEQVLMYQTDQIQYLLTA